MIPQESDNWCWAACIQYVMRFSNVSIQQNKIVKRLIGKPDQSAQANEMDVVAALNSFGFPAQTLGTLSYGQIKKLLANNKRLIVGGGPQGYEHFWVIDRFNPFSNTLLLLDPIDASKSYYSFEALTWRLNWDTTVIVEPLDEQLKKNSSLRFLYDSDHNSIYYQFYCPFYERKCSSITNGLKTVLGYMHAFAPDRFADFLKSAHRLAYEVNFPLINENLVPVQQHKLSKSIHYSLSAFFHSELNTFTAPYTPIQKAFRSSENELHASLNDPKLYHTFVKHFSPAALFSR